jgi:hypothetical protein
MHGGRASARISAILLAIPLAGCVGSRTTKHTYAAGTSSPVVRVGGAAVRLQLSPQGTDGGAYALSAMVVSAAAVTLAGPFKGRIEAVGQEGRHDILTVHRIRTRTMVTRRDEWYPESHLGRRVDFRKRSGVAGEWRAVYEIPGLLKVKPREDGALEVLVDMTIGSAAGRERRVVRFRLDPTRGRKDEFMFLPAEIVKSIGKPMPDPQDWGWE